MNKINEVKKKREFSSLPNSIIFRALKLGKGDVKETRSLLRKYFGVFLTNKVIKGKGKNEEILNNHLSSKKRDYEKFYKKILESIGFVDTIIDLGAGVNGFSIHKMHEIFGIRNYYGIEAVGQIVDLTNKYFDEKCKDFDAHMIQEDLFNLKEVLKIIEKTKGIKVIFMFQIIDALENLEKDFSKKFILKIMNKAKYLVITLPLVSIGGKKKFLVKRKWITEFLEENFEILNSFEMSGEKVIILQNS